MSKSTAIIILVVGFFGVFGLQINYGMDSLRATQNMQHLRMVELENMVTKLLLY